MNKLIASVALAAMVGAGQLAVAAPVQAAGPPSVHHVDKSFTARKGHKLPSTQKRQHIGERDYKRYGLQRPPRGYEWVRVGDKFVMIAITTGIIGAILGAALAH